VRWITSQDVLEEAADGCAPAIARRGPIRALTLDVIEEVSDRVRVQMRQLEGSDAAMTLLRYELQKKLQCIPIRSDSMCARTSLMGQILGKEGLNQREQRPMG
jgi:hypothetical protein